MRETGGFSMESRRSMAKVCLRCQEHRVTTWAQRTTRVAGNKTKWQAMGSTNTQTEPSIRESGKIISTMDAASMSSPMAQCTKEIGKTI